MINYLRKSKRTWIPSKSAGICMHELRHRRPEVRVAHTTSKHNIDIGELTPVGFTHTGRHGCGSDLDITRKNYRHDHLMQTQQEIP